MIDGLAYGFRPDAARNQRQLHLDEYLDAATLYAGEAIRRAAPAVVHAASNFLNGLPAMLAAKQAGLPAVYAPTPVKPLTGSRR